MNLRRVVLLALSVSVLTAPEASAELIPSPDGLSVYDTLLRVNWLADANLAGTPGLSLPVGLAPEDGLPVGLQVMAPVMADDRLYRVGAALEAALLDRWGAPILDGVPAL